MNEFLEFVHNFFESIGTNEHAFYNAKLNEIKNKKETLLLSVELLNQTKDLKILFALLIIIRDNILYRWVELEKEQMKIIELKLISLIQEFRDEANYYLNKAIVCIADIIAYNFEMLEDITDFSMFKKCLFFIMFIEELDNEWIQVNLSIPIITQIQNAILPIILDVIRNISVSDLFFILLKKAFNCSPNFYPFLEFLPVVDNALQFPQFHKFILEIVQTFLNTNLITIDHPDRLFCENIFSIAIKLSHIFALNGEYEEFCKLWKEIFGYSPDKLLVNNNNVLFTTNLLNQFIQMSKLLPQTFHKYHELLYEICLFLSTFPQSKYQFLDEKICLLNILIHILDSTLSELLINAVKEVINSLGDLIFKYKNDILKEDSSPGILITFIQIPNIPYSIITTLCVYVINNYYKIPQEHLIYFILNYGINYSDFKQEWLEILITLIPQAEWNSINAINKLLDKYNDLIPFVPKELIQRIILNIKNLGPNHLLLSLKFIQLFFVELSYDIFSKYEESILYFANLSISSLDENVIFSFVSFLKCFNEFAKVNNELKQNLISQVLELFKSSMSLYEDEFIQKIYFEILNI